jgi:hypothetical protein
MNALDTLAGLTSAALAITDLMKAAQQLGREPTEAEIDAALAESADKHMRARQLVEIARQREAAAPTG